ncbi:MAG: tRNA pseudouridine(55) synthase TruB [Clostridiales bacterium]|nr:tRNA pseudouridine(55) synthase TruB [Clostridiales bacterium]
MDGFLVANKPRGMTSSDVVVTVRRLLPRGTAIGHGGTLDPEASGVLPLCIGKATRLFDYVIDKKKTYVAELQLGVETDTQDATGNVVRTSPITADREALLDVLPTFTGDIEQIPPMYSAIKQNGKRLYKLARSGEIVERPARRCHVDDIRLTAALGEDRYRIEVDCGKGVYIRTLCHDIGNALGCGGHMAALTRMRAGLFDLQHALTPDEIRRAAQEGALEAKLYALDAPIEHLPKVTVGPEAAHAVKNGNPLRPQWLTGDSLRVGEAARIYLEDRFAGIGEAREDGCVRFRCMLYGDG